MDPATAMVAGAALVPFTLAPLFLKSLGLPFDVEKEVKWLESTLENIKALLSDAEERQIKKESVCLWLDLKHFACESEDIIDEHRYRALRSKIEEALSPTRLRKLTDLFRVTHFFSRFSSEFELGSQIKKIRESWDEIERKSNQFPLKLMYGSRSEMLRMLRPTSSNVDESNVFGREADREKVVRLLASDDSSAKNGIGVVTISGMGGIGKTTLAQLACQYYKRLVKHFDVIIWVFVSQDFDRIRVTKEILESLTNSSCHHLTNFDTIQGNIMSILKEKRFLLVLDNVWNANVNDWSDFRIPLTVAARGSRILVTTRSLRVSSMIGTVPTYSLQCPSDDACWSLFKTLAFVEGDSDVHPDLVKIGKEIVNKCKGLPLAVKTLGGLLRSNLEVAHWKSILESELWDLPDENNDILPALRLSCDRLPAHLKQCFAYCCMFPKGLYIDGEELVWSWMALGFIQPEGSKDMEDIGKEYLADLVSRSLLYYSFSFSSFSFSFYKMHDLIRDLARSVLGAEILQDGDVKSHKNAAKVLHISCDQFSRSSVKSFNFKDLYCFKRLRTLLFPGDLFIGTIPPELFENLRHIRILSLSGNHITELPESIGNLIKLRMLDLSCTKIERLPKSITKLYELQTLNLTNCKNLVEVPSDFGNLVKLTRILSNGCPASIPFGRFKCLKDMPNLMVRKEIGWRVNELRDMNCLRGDIRISNLENVISVEEAKEAELKNKQKIKKLELEWESHDVDSRQEGIIEGVLNALQPHSNLKRLTIRGYCGVRFPPWLGYLSFSKLVSISLYTCKCPALPPFGQLPSLENLALVDLYGLKKVGREVYGDGMVKGFPSLKVLDFRSMHDLEEWTAQEGDMIHLSEISLLHCPKLRVLPDIFPPKLDRLFIQDCPLVTKKYKVGGEYWRKISHIRLLCIDAFLRKEGEVIR